MRGKHWEGDRWRKGRGRQKEGKRQKRVGSSMDGVDTVESEGFLVVGPIVNNQKKIALSITNNKVTNQRKKALKITNNKVTNQRKKALKITNNKVTNQRKKALNIANTTIVSHDEADNRKGTALPCSNVDEYPGPASTGARVKTP
ncbi:hypothetical protein KM043_013752 [Ampulex compressa]|nr:hypothetical protein KM043_013752 [Ampulex compressa]